MKNWKETVCEITSVLLLGIRSISSIFCFKNLSQKHVQVMETMENFFLPFNPLNIYDILQKNMYSLQQLFTNDISITYSKTLQCDADVGGRAFIIDLQAKNHI